MAAPTATARKPRDPTAERLAAGRRAITRVNLALTYLPDAQQAARAAGWTRQADSLAVAERDLTDLLRKLKDRLATDQAAADERKAR